MYRSSKRRARKKKKRKKKQKEKQRFERRKQRVESNMPRSSCQSDTDDIDSGFSRQSRYTRKWPEAWSGNPEAVETVEVSRRNVETSPRSFSGEGLSAGIPRQSTWSEGYGSQALVASSPLPHGDGEVSGFHGSLFRGESEQLTSAPKERIKLY